MANSLKTQYDFLFVGKDEGSFVENYAYDLGEGSDASGKIFINLEIAQNSVDAEKVGEIIFDKMRKVFFADSEVDGYERFEESLKEVNLALNEYKLERENDWLGKLNVIIAAIVGDQLYLTQSGEAEAYLVRKRFATTISDDLDETESKDIFTNIASGELESGDFVLLSTTRLLRYVSKTDLAKHVNGQLQNTVTAIKEFLHGEVISKIALVAVQANVVKGAMSAAPSAMGNEPVAHEREEAYQDMSARESNLENKTVNGNLSADKLKSIFSKSVGKIRDKFDSVGGGKGNSRRGSKGEFSWSFSNWGRDQMLVAIIVLIALLTLGVWWLRSKADEDQKVQDLASSLVQVQEEINSAVTTGQFDKGKAGDMLADAEQKALVVLDSGYQKAKARELLDLIMETRDKMDGVIHPKAEKMADLTQKRANVSAIGLIHQGANLFAYEYNALYPIMLDKVADPLTIDDNEKVISATPYDDKQSILFYTAAGKVIEYKDDRMSFLQTSDGAFKSGKVIKAYSNKMYLLDPVGNQIWRYTRRRDTFDAAEPYAVGATLKNAVDMAIDGSIYILNTDGSISKLFQGQVQDFPVKNAPVKAVTNPTRIYTEPDMNQIYVLEPSTSRVLSYTKDERTGGATYTGQYIFDELTDIQDFYVDKNTNTMYVLTSNAVYRTNL